MTKNGLIRHVTLSEGYWEIPGVKYSGGIHTSRLYDKLTHPMRFEELAEYSRTEKQKGNPYAVGLPKFMAMCSAGKEDTALMAHIQSVLRKYYPSFLSAVDYMPALSKGRIKDRITHDYGMPDESSVERKFIGPDGWIKGIKDKKFLKLVSGMENIQTLDEVSSAINQTPMYLYRLNSRPSETKDRRVVWFDADSDRLYLVCDSYPLDECPAFRVEID
jgi:hypothetical protein